MPRLLEKLDRAGIALRQSVEKVQKTPPAQDSTGGASSTDRPEHLRLRRTDSIREHSMAALHAAVWIASFVQSVFNQITGRSDDL